MDKYIFHRTHEWLYFSKKIRDIIRRVYIRDIFVSKLSNLSLFICLLLDVLAASSFVAMILILGIIHLGVGIGIVARYHKYEDTFQPQVSLSGYNIFIALCTIALGILGLVSVFKLRICFCVSVIYICLIH